MKLLHNIKKIIIFRALQLGDMLCIIPAMRALRSAYPNAEITLTGLPWAASLVKRFPKYFDEFVVFPGYPGLPEQEFDAHFFNSFLSKIQEQKFDLALQMQGNGYLVNPMVLLFSAKYTAGFFKPDDYHPDNGLFLKYPNEGSEIERHLSLMNYLGIPSQGNHLEFPLYQEDFKDFEQLSLAVEPNSYVCIHPGSRGSWRQWPTEHFAKLADYCMEQGLTAVLTGTKDELHIVQEVVNQMHYMPVIATGSTSLGAVGILIKNAFALISNCTGVSHMAAAFKTPSVVISMDGEPERWAPINREIHRTVDWTKVQEFDIVLKELKTLMNNRKEMISK